VPGAPAKKGLLALSDLSHDVEALDAEAVVRDARNGVALQRPDRWTDGLDTIDAAILEQRQYTEFACSRLEARMDAGFSRLGERFDRLARKLDQFIDLHL